MRRRLPPLNALLAFEAAARHLSFTEAAEELYVTQAAISHQVKATEEHLGVKLFRRLNRALYRRLAENQGVSPVAAHRGSTRDGRLVLQGCAVRLMPHL